MGTIVINLVSISIRAITLPTEAMAPETRSHEFKRLEDSIESINKEQI